MNTTRESIENWIDLETLETPLQSWEKDLFICTPYNKPEPKKAILTLNDIPVLTYQNFSFICAPPGSGKSSVCASICASVINPNCDTLGLKISSDVNKILMIDTEQTDTDVWNAYDRMLKRAESDDNNKVIFVGMRGKSTYEERIKSIKALIENHRPQLVIIDGITDLLTDINNNIEAVGVMDLIKNMTEKYNLSILTTIHPNKKDLTPRGHIGSYAIQKSESSLIIKTNGSIKTLTNDYDHGKGRNSGKCYASFTWCKELRMFVSCESDEYTLPKHPPHETLTTEEIQNLVKNITTGKELNRTDFKDQLGIELRKNPRIKTSSSELNFFIQWLKENEYTTSVKQGKMNIITLNSKHA